MLERFGARLMQPSSTASLRHRLGTLLRRFMLAALVAGIGLTLYSQSAAAKFAAILIDYQTGEVLHAVDPDQPIHPASLTKMMTLYLAFEALAQGRLSLDQRLLVSDWAASMVPTKLGLRPGERIRVEDLMLGMITRSANDAAVVLAEGLGGSESNFGRMMTQRARRTWPCWAGR
jgi:D-alanyl-D-alanine carboxypeptidase